MMVWWMEIFTQKNVHPPQSFNTRKFTTLEIKALCKLFQCKFDYLFAEENEEQGA